MVLRLTRVSYDTGLPTRRASPARTVKNDRCFECRLGTPSDVHHTNCLYQTDFTPTRKHYLALLVLSTMLIYTANRFSILAELHSSPETKWAFDFVPTTRSNTRRRGKRGGKRHKRKDVLKESRKRPTVDGLDKFCNRSVALRLDDHAPASEAQTLHCGPQPRISSGDSASLVNSVRHHWAPQFRPNSLPMSKQIVAEPTNVKSITLQKPPHSVILPKSVQSPSTHFLRTCRPYPRYPLSTFLKDLASPAHCAGYWPPKTSTPKPTLESVDSPHTVYSSESPIFGLPGTLAQPAAAAAVCCTLPLSGNTTSSSSDNAVRTHQAVPTTPLSDNTTPTHERFPAFEFLQFTTLPSPVSRTPPTLALLSAPMREATISTDPYQAPPLFKMPTTLPEVFHSSAAHSSIASTPVLGRITTGRPSHPCAPNRSRWGWQEVDESITIFHTSPSALTTAPVTSPYPRVYSPQLWTPATLLGDNIEYSAAVSSMVSRKPVFGPPSPETQEELEDFLDMGHAEDCWCTRHKRSDPSCKTTIGDTAEKEVHATSTRDVVEEFVNSSHSSGFGVAIDLTHASYGLPALQGNSEDSSSESDAVLVTPSSEGTGSAFEDLFNLDKISPPMDSDDDEWIAVSPCLQTRRMRVLPPSYKIPDASVRNLERVLMPAPPTTPLSSPLRTPYVPEHQARVSDTESETDSAKLRSRAASSVRFVQETSETEVEFRPGLVHSNAEEWSTLQEAVRAKSVEKGASRKYDDDEWGGKVWDGVTDWFW